VKQRDVAIAPFQLNPREGVVVKQLRRGSRQELADRAEREAGDVVIRAFSAESA
jgi:hypothetical protein